VLEGEADHLPAGWTPIDGVTVGYGSDEAMYDSWGSGEDRCQTTRRRTTAHPSVVLPLSSCWVAICSWICCCWRY
jgi:hypothetical protein